MVEANDTLGLANESGYLFYRPTQRPRSLVRQEAVDGCDVDPCWVVVDLILRIEHPLHSSALSIGRSTAMDGYCPPAPASVRVLCRASVATGTGLRSRSTGKRSTCATSTTWRSSCTRIMCGRCRSRGSGYAAPRRISR